MSLQRIRGAPEESVPLVNTLNQQVSSITGGEVACSGKLSLTAVGYLITDDPEYCHMGNWPYQVNDHPSLRQRPAYATVGQGPVYPRGCQLSYCGIERSVGHSVQCLKSVLYVILRKDRGARFKSVAKGVGGIYISALVCCGRL